MSGEVCSRTGAGAAVVGGGAASSNSSMFSKITPETAKMEYMKYLATLLKLPKEYSIILTRNFENLLIEKLLPINCKV